MTTLALPGVRLDLVSSVAGAWTFDADTLVTTAAPGTDVFVSPGRDAAPKVDAVTLLAAAPAGDFRLSARVEVDFAAAFDAGVLFLYLDHGHWAKLCLEYSPENEPMVVSVVCREVADDANGFVVADNSVWLRVSRTGVAFAYHASLDGQKWHLIRHFDLGAGGGGLQVGFLAQSPTGPGCAVRFSGIQFVEAGLDDLRDGS